MTIKSENFDSDELLHLAMHASQHNETEKAINYLKRSQVIEPENAKVIYMLGSLHAEIGMYDRAIKEMQQAIDIDPGLHTAQFQLGLLELTSGNVEKAKQAWVALESLNEAHYLRVFSDGLILLTQDKLDEAIQALQTGILINKENIPLNNDMANFIVEIEKGKHLVSPQELATSDKIKDTNSDDAGQRILSAYQSDFNH